MVTLFRRRQDEHAVSRSPRRDGPATRTKDRASPIVTVAGLSRITDTVRRPTTRIIATAVTQFSVRNRTGSRGPTTRLKRTQSTRTLGDIRRQTVNLIASSDIGRVDNAKNRLADDTLSRGRRQRRRRSPGISVFWRKNRSNVTTRHVVNRLFDVSKNMLKRMNITR